MSALAFFGFLIFGWVDSFLVQQNLVNILIFRGTVVAALGCVFALTLTSWGRQHFVGLGIVVCLICGFGVVILTGMTGGLSSPYWTMIMVAFFGTSLILPLRVSVAAGLYVLITGFYILWMAHYDTSGSVEHWATSLAGIGLAGVISVSGTAYLSEIRRRDRDAHDEMLRINTQLLSEIKERERAEALVLRTQQLDAVGRLGAGLAHELNNLLAVIAGAAESIKTSPEHSRKDAERILQSAQMGGDLTRNLLAFSREHQRENRPVEVNAIVTNVCALLRQTYPRRIQILQEGFEHQYWLEGDGPLLTQALLNLCLNGVHAMEEQGILRIRATSPDDDQLTIDVIDEGCGMSQAVLKQAVEPFFTTRPPGEGTGLGLSMVYGTVQDHQGTLDIQSRVGEGTTVRMTFPLLRKHTPLPPTAPPVKPVPAPQRVGSLAGLHVALVEDDDVLQEVMSEYLKLAGCTVTSFVSGQECLEQWDTLTTIPDLVVLDRIMPGMSGIETFHALRSKHSTIPVLLYSGLMPDALTQQILENGHASFIQKPFRRAKFIEKLEELLPSVERNQNTSRA